MRTTAGGTLAGRLLLVFGLVVTALPVVVEGAIVEEIVAKVNNRIITKSEIDERAEVMVRQIYQEYYGEELDRELKKAQDDLLANLITENLLLERAETIFDLEKIRSTLIADFRKQQEIESDEALDRLLKEQNMERRELEDHLIRMAVPQEIIKYDVRRRISVSEREASDYYVRHRADWETPPTVTFREIVLFYDNSNRADAKRRAEELLAEARGGADFEELARDHSEAGTREGGGLLGPLPAADLNATIAAAAFALEVGEVSDPIDTSRSLHVIRLEEKTPLVVKEFDEVREEVEGVIRQEKFSRRYERYIRKLWKQNQIEVMPKYEQLLVNSPLDPKPGGSS